MGNNETTPLRPDSLLSESTKANESRIRETSGSGEMVSGATGGSLYIRMFWQYSTLPNSGATQRITTATILQKCRRCRMEAI